MKPILKATRKTEEAAENLFDEVTEQVVKTPAKPKAKAAKKSFAQDDKIECHSVTLGGLFIDGPQSKIPYRFIDYGDVQKMEYRDLVAMVRLKSGYLMTPNFIVDDVDFLAEFPQLEQLYSETYGTQDLLDLFELPVDEMVKKIKALPSGAMDNLKHLASTQVANGGLDSVKKIKALDEIWGTDLNLTSELMRS